MTELKTNPSRLRSAASSTSSSTTSATRGMATVTNNKNPVMQNVMKPIKTTKASRLRAAALGKESQSKL